MALPENMHRTISERVGPEVADMIEQMHDAVFPPDEGGEDEAGAE